MQLHYYIDTTPNFCTTLTNPDNVNYVYTYLPVSHYCYYENCQQHPPTDYYDSVQCIMFIYSLRT